MESKQIQKTQKIMNLEEISKLSVTVCNSRLFPSITNANQAFTLMMLCQSDGIHPIQAMRRYDIIKGRPALKVTSVLADFKKSGGRYNIVEKSDKKCEINFEHDGTKYKSVWDLEDAKKANLLHKDNWKMYPRAMLFARCVSEGVRTVHPEVMQGIYTPEETRDFVDFNETETVENVKIIAPTNHIPDFKTIKHSLSKIHSIIKLNDFSKKFEEKYSPEVWKEESESDKTWLDTFNDKKENLAKLTSNKKVRGTINQKLLTITTEKELKKIITDFEADYPELKNTLTGINDQETFEELFKQHSERIETSNRDKLELFTRMIKSCDSIEKFHGIESFYGEHAVLQKSENDEAINNLGKELLIDGYC